jgi:6-phosphofructokinase 1
MKKIGVFTSGGDAPGMNACIRAVVRASSFHGIEPVGIIRGYEGLIDGDFMPLNSGSVSNIIQRGGTLLRSARSKRFMTPEGLEKARQNVEDQCLDALVAIGGDGTFRGGLALSKLTSIPIMGVPGTIDNDLFGTDFTIGFDSATNTVIEAVDKIRDTAASHDRLFFIEVMGRDAGMIALSAGIGVGAEAILIPESHTSIEKVIEILQRGWNRQKSSSIILVAEGEESGGAFEVARKVKQRFAHYETRVTILGHIQRGGSPTCADRVLASRLGVAAVEGLMKGKKNVMAGIINGSVVYSPLEKAIKHNNEIDGDLLRISGMLSL